MFNYEFADGSTVLDILIYVIDALLLAGFMIMARMVGAQRKTGAKLLEPDRLCPPTYINKPIFKKKADHHGRP